MAELEERSKTEPISLMDLHDAIRREEAEKPAEKKPVSKSERPSVLALLKQPLPEQSAPNKTAPMKGAEMEI